jgi:hypothetical protein
MPLRFDAVFVATLFALSKRVYERIQPAVSFKIAPLDSITLV